MRLVVPGCVSDVRGVPGLRVFVLASAMALYLSMGASVFQAIEGPLERETEERVERLKINFLEDHPCVSESNEEHLDLVAQTSSLPFLMSTGNVSATNKTNEKKQWRPSKHEVSEGFIYKVRTSAEIAAARQR